MAKDYIEAGRGGNWSPGRTWVLMILVAVITGLAVWLVPVNEQLAPPSLPALPSAPDTPEPLPLPSAAVMTEELQLPPPSGGGIADLTTGGDGARTFLYELRATGEEPDPDVVFAEAERMQGVGDLAQAALTLGTQADPAFHAGAASFLPEPDAGQAYRWYSVAVAANSETAVQRLQDLHKRVQQDAVAGDEQARRLLLQWQ
jgi:hypothetical protein